MALWIIVSFILGGLLTYALTYRQQKHHIKQYNKVIAKIATLEKNIKQRESLLNAASEISIISTDVEGAIISFNHGAEHMLGYAKEDVIGKQVPELFHVTAEIEQLGAELSAILQEDIQGFDVFVQGIKHEAIQSREWTYIRKDGSRLPIHLIVNVIRDDNETITGYLGIAIDISKEKRLECTLEKTENTYKYLLDHSPNLILVCIDEQIEYMNIKAMSSLGIKDAESLHLYKVEDFIHPNDLPTFHAPSAGNAKQLMMVSVHGQPITVEMFVIETHYCQFPGYLYIAADLTANKAAVGAQARLLSILEETEDLIGMTDEKGQVIYLNKAMKRLQGKRNAPIDSFDFAEFYPSWEKSHICQHALKAAQNFGSWKGETVFISEDGTLLPVFQTILAHTNELGEIQCYSSVARDLRIIRSEEELRMSKIILQKTLEAQEQERCALAKELHDGIGQSLYYVSLGLHSIIPEIPYCKHIPLFTNILSQLDQAIQEIRSYTLQLRPQTLEHLGLIVSINKLIQSYRVAYPQLVIQFQHQLPVHIHESIEINIYRIIQEAFSNTIKHGQATQIDITIHMITEQQLQIIFRDNGVGFTPDAMGSGLGLRHMEERIHGLSGKFEIQTDTGKGTALIATVPV